MANRRPPVNRVTSKRRPAAARGSASRTTAADLRTGDSTRTTETTTRAQRPGTTAQRGPSSTKGAAKAPGVEPRTPGRFWRTWRTAIVCGVAALLLAVFAVVAAFGPGVDDGNAAYVDNKATDEVKAAGDNALTMLYGYKAKDIDKWKDEVGSVLTTQMRKDLDKYIGTVVSSIKQAQTDTQVKTDPIGVTLLTDDRAELLVNLNVATVQDGKPTPLVSGPILLHMEKVDGRWLASEITDK
ncbi:hypothetical protein [Nocardia jejuensis]|uniref:hypothetical protein n=1 Tax=Nocardia jejuensis TaxID=328049 RepID=UPI00082ED1BE|nr:hypothetical protein [Nocardia jejuensis]